MGMEKQKALTQLSDGVEEFNKVRKSKTPIPEKIKELICEARLSGASEDETMEASQLSRPTIRRYGKKIKQRKSASRKIKPNKKIRELKIIPARKMERVDAITASQVHLIEVRLSSGVRLSVSREMIDLDFINLLNGVRAC